jgi:hypothetical protein
MRKKESFLVLRKLSFLLRKVVCTANFEGERGLPRGSSEFFSRGLVQHLSLIILTVAAAPIELKTAVTEL